jgi:hypothetical protein
LPPAASKVLRLAPNWHIPLLSALPNGRGTEHKRHKKDTKSTKKRVHESIVCAFCFLLCVFCDPSLFRWAKPFLEKGVKYVDALEKWGVCALSRTSCSLIRPLHTSQVRACLRQLTP